jgi:chromosomal replication initiator protein
MADMLGVSKSAEKARARQVAMYLARELTDCSLHEIGKAMEKDHSTVAKAHRTVRRRRTLLQRARSIAISQGIVL